MNIESPTGINLDYYEKGDSEQFCLGDTAYFRLKRVSGVVQKVGKTYLVLETFNKYLDKIEVINVPKNKCYKLEEADSEEVEEIS